MRRRNLAALFAVLVTSFGMSAHAEDARLAFLARMLKGSAEYRVRVQAALSLGEIGSRGASASLIAALDDAHPAVRAAAAGALGRVGDSSALAALEARGRDSNAAVRSAARRSLRTLRTAAEAPSAPAEEGPEEAPRGPARFYVLVGAMGNSTKVRDSEIKGLLKQSVREALSRTTGVRVAPEGESQQAAKRSISRQRLTGYIVTASVTKLQQTVPGTIRAEVSAMVLDADGNLRMMPRGIGEATARSATDVTAQNMAVQAAASGAVHSFTRQIGAGP